jgi:uncharacterized protein YcnI
MAASAAALIVPSAAFAHAHVSPPVVETKAGQEFSLAVPNEKNDAKTVKIELTPPAGFAVDSFAASPGWKRNVEKTGSGEEAVVEKVTWSNGSVSPGEYAVFRFLADADKSATYSFKVRQTYSDGSVVDWTGPESSDTPAPTVEAVSSIGGGGGTPLVAVVALIVGAIALVLASLGFLLGGRAAA